MNGEKPRQGWDTLLETPPATPSRVTADELQTLVRRDLRPSYGMLFSKTLGLHAVAATLSLMACPQFGFHPLGLRFDPLAFLSAYGDAVCGLGCGIAFSLLTGIAARVFLNRDERRVAAKQGFWILTPVMALSWMLLMWAGQPHPESHHSVGGEATLLFSALWLVGAVAAAWAGLLNGASQSPATDPFRP